MTLTDPSAAVAAQEPLARDLFDALRSQTHDGIGITRASYGPGEQAARDIMAAGAEGLGMAVEDDAAGNVYMTLAGSDPDAAPIVIGSHIDSVAQGGNFDGAAGVVSGLVACAGLQAAGITPPRDIRVMGIRAEESAWFGVSYIGSRSALGVLPEGALDTARRADTGRTLADHMAEAGCNPQAIRDGEVYLPAGSVHAYLEVHIEQGPVLEEAGLPVGVVTGIRGNRRLPNARCIGEYSHCGGVPRSHRRDAVIATAELVGALDDIWSECEDSGQDFAFTIGKFFTDAEWHAMTKIAGAVEFSLDMRSLDGDFVEAMTERVRQIAAGIAERRGVTFELGEFTRAAPGPMDPKIMADMQDGVAALGIQSMPIASGASHDAAAFAAAGVPTQMLFIRNANGSHNPDEAMEIPDFMTATRLLAWWLANRAG
ncbi:MAG: Zn-dependent hydrolase [Rhodospirillaceae bacterium]|nr:Zn-dependent hydrolase [Rhodospirillaceae bacterium]